MKDATLFAIDEINGVGGINGREIVPLCFDPASDSAEFFLYANKLLSEFGVKIIFGCYMSNSRKAVLKAVTRRNALLLYPAQYEGFEYSRNAIYCGAVPNQNAFYLGKYLLNRLGRRFYIVGSDYIWPRESDRIMTEMVLRDGGEIAGRGYLKFDAPREAFSALIADIKSKQPDVIFCNFVGESIVHFYRAYADAGLSSNSMPIASLTTSEADIQAMGSELGAGHFTSASYFQSCQNPDNIRCLERYRLKAGAAAVTNMCWEAAYFQVHLAADALREVESDDIDLLRPAILGKEFDAPQGRIRVEPSNGHTHVWPKIGRARSDGQFDIVWASERVEPDPYLASFMWNSQNAEEAEMSL